MTTIVPAPQQHEEWGRQAQQWYSRHEAIEQQWGALSDGLLDLAGVTTGDRVLDLACGVGDPAVAAAVRVGPTGSVVATDISPDMLTLAVTRAAAAGLTNLGTHRMDAGSIDLPDATMDAVLCRLGLMFLPDLDGALSGVRRVLVPGGRFAAAVPWRPAGNAMVRLVDAVLGALGVTPPPSDAPGCSGIFGLADASVVCAALEGAGMTGIRVVPCTLAQDHRSAQDWVDFVLALNVPLRRLLTGVSPDRLRTARGAAHSVAERYLGADGHVRFPFHFYYAVATRPAR